MKQQQKQTGITLFYSYTSNDKQWRDQLTKHLSQLKRDGLIEVLYDDLILAGEKHSSKRDRMLRSAQIILLLISSDYLASDAQYEDEMKQALERHQREEVHVIPIILRPCDWQSSPFADLQRLPRNGTPVVRWDNQDEAFLSIVQELRLIIGLHQAHLEKTRLKLSPMLTPIASDQATPTSKLVPGTPTTPPQGFPLSPSSSTPIIKPPKCFRSPFTVAGLILLMLIILVGSNLATYGIVAGNTAHNQATIQASATVRTLTTGRIWHTQISGNTNHLAAVVWSGSQFVAIGDKGTILTSLDGHAWVARNSGIGGSLSSIVWSGSQYVIVGGNGAILTSPDGRSWSVQHSGTSNSLTGIAWSGSRFVAVGSNATILTSTDGFSWTTVQDFPAGDELLSAVTWSGSQFMTVSESMVTYTSPDGLRWTGHVVGGGFYNNVTWLDSRFVLVGHTTVLISFDGDSWVGQTSELTRQSYDLYAVAWSGAQFVAVGGNNFNLATNTDTKALILTSPDGYTWTAQVPGTSNPLWGIAWSGSRFVVVGDNGTILTSP